MRSSPARSCLQPQPVPVSRLPVVPRGAAQPATPSQSSSQRRGKADPRDDPNHGGGPRPGAGGSWSWRQEGRPSMPRGELKLNCGGDDDRIGGWNTLLEGHKMASMAYRPDLGPCGARQAGRWWLHPCEETTMTCHAHGPERSERSLVPKLMTALPEEEKVGSSSWWCHLWPKVS